LWNTVLPRGDAGGSGKVVLADGLSAAGVGHFVVCAYKEGGCLVDD
jgi:hypothetical protein